MLRWSSHGDDAVRVGGCTRVANPATTTLTTTTTTTTTIQTGKCNKKIPGLYFGIPGFASAGAVCDVDVEGSLGCLDVSIGLNACVDTIFGQICGSDLSSVLPINIWSGSYNFSSICGNSSSNSSSTGGTSTWRV